MLAAFYDVAATFTVEDFYGRDLSYPIVIRVTYGQLRENEKAEFAPYIHDDLLIVAKRIEGGVGRFTQKYFAAAKQIPEFAELRKLGKRDRINKYKEIVKGAKVFLAYTARATRIRSMH